VAQSSDRWSADVIAARMLATAVAALAGAVPAGAGPAPATAARTPHAVTIQTFPRVPYARFRLGQRVVLADQSGRLTISATSWSSLRQRLHYVPDLSGRMEQLRFNRWSGAFQAPKLDRLKAYLATWYRVNPTFEDSRGRSLAPGVVTTATLRSSIGEQVTLSGTRPIWLKGRRVVLGPFGPRSKPILYRVDSVRAGSTEVVFRARQQFVPGPGSHVRIHVRFYYVRFTARDAIFGFGSRGQLRLTHPDGHVERLHLAHDGSVQVGPLARGEYRVAVVGALLGGSQPLTLSRDEDLQLQVLSPLDAAAAGGSLLVVAAAILLVGRPHLRVKLLRSLGRAAARIRRANIGVPQ
jgi:hypothetical protein